MVLTSTEGSHASILSHPNSLCVYYEETSFVQYKSNLLLKIYCRTIMITIHNLYDIQIKTMFY